MKMEKEIIALYCNKRNALIKNQKRKVSEDKNVVPFWSGEEVMVPLQFFADSISATVSGEASEPVAVLQYRDLTIAVELVLKEGVSYIPLQKVCQQLGLYCFADVSGLVLYSEQQMELGWARDGAFLRKIAERFIYEEVEGSQIVALIREKHPQHGHPRLIMTEERFAAIRSNLASANPEPFYRALFQKVRAKADACLQQTPTDYEIRDGVRLLFVSQEIKEKVLSLAMTYQLTLDERYANRAWQEMEHAACFPDWHPWHMLDTGELALALAFGYDWLYHWLGEQKRTVIRNAIIRNAFTALVNDYNGLTVTGDDHQNPLHRSWYWRGGHPVNNWRFIAGGGVAVGAIALADELSGRELAMCEQILSQSLLDIRAPLGLFAPAGAYPEGINYWCYAMSYFTYHIGSLISATGQDFGYMDVPGLKHTTDFVMAVNGAASVFNYGDAGRAAASVGWPVMFFAHLYGSDEAVQASVHAAANARIHLICHKENGCAEDFFYYEPSFAEERQDSSVLPDTYLPDSEVFAARTGYDTQAIYLAMQCGDNFADHGQYDMGTFVLDAMGENFFLDLGADNYNLPNRFTDAYRYRAEGHNTIVIDPDASAGQIFEATALIDRHYSDPKGAFAISDITSAYAGQAESMHRGIRLDRDRRLAVVQDEVHLKKKSDFWWFAHTDAQIVVAEDGRKAYLTKNSKCLIAEIISGERAAFSVMDARPMEHSPRVKGQAENAGIRKLVIHIEKCKDLELAVVFTMKAPASDHTDGRACTDRCMGICRASRYEHKSTVSIAKQCDMRIPAVIAGARSAEQSAFIHGGAGEAGMEVRKKEVGQEDFTYSFQPLDTWK